MATFQFTSPEGKKYSVQGPDGATQEQAFQILQSQMAESAKPETSLMDDVKQGAGNIAAGLVRGAGSIGATIVDQVRSKLADPVSQAIPENMRIQPASALRDAPRGPVLRSQMDAGLQTMGAEPESWMYKGGKLAGEIAGTAGASGAVANSLLRTAPAVASYAPAVANLMTKAAPAIQSGGLSLGAGAPTNALANLALRSAGGAINGGVSAGLVNPEDFGTGMLIGGALPGAVKAVGAAGSKIGRAHV